MKKLSLEEKIAVLEKASKRLERLTRNAQKQQDLKVRIKKLHPYAVIPTYAHDTDAGMDLTAVSKTVDEYGNIVYGFGLAFEIPEGYVGLVFPRSSVCKSNLLLTNSVGVIDSGYRGEVTAKFAVRDNLVTPSSFFDRIKLLFRAKEGSNGRHIFLNTHNIYNIGDRVAQMIIVPYPKVTFKEANDLSQTERADGGYGSSGK